MLELIETTPFLHARSSIYVLIGYTGHAACRCGVQQQYPTQWQATTRLAAPRTKHLPNSDAGEMSAHEQTVILSSGKEMQVSEQQHEFIRLRETLPTPEMRHSVSRSALAVERRRFKCRLALLL